MLKNIQREVESLKQKVVEMYNLVYSMIVLSKTSLITPSESKKDDIMKMEETVNKYQIYIDQISYAFLGLYSPHAYTLRFVIMCIKISDELERIGDLAVNIVQNAQYLDQTVESYIKDKIGLMFEKVMEMFNLSRTSFVQEDMETAKKTLAMDTEVDNLKLEVLHDMMAYVLQNSQASQQYITTILIAKNLERMGDHLTNIAEETLYIASGLDVRHRNVDLDNLKK
jgi:phosphate transport system protein